MKHWFVDRYSDRDSFVHRLDPRSKICVFGGMVLGVSVLPQCRAGVLWVYAVIIVLVAAAARVSLWYVCSRALAVAPFAFIALAGTAAGAALQHSGNPGRWDFWLSPWVLVRVCKALLCTASFALLAATTPVPCLLRGLELLRFPRVFLMVLLFLYRYLFVLSAEFEHCSLAFRARYIRPGAFPRDFQELGGMVGCFLVRSFEHAELVYGAMLARGYDGTVRTVNRLRFTVRDAAVAVAAAAVNAVLVVPWRAP